MQQMGVTDPQLQTDGVVGALEQPKKKEQLTRVQVQGASQSRNEDSTKAPNSISNESRSRIPRRKIPKTGGISPPKKPKRRKECLHQWIPTRGRMPTRGSTEPNKNRYGPEGIRKCRREKHQYNQPNQLVSQKQKKNTRNSGGANQYNQPVGVDVFQV